MSVETTSRRFYLSTKTQQANPLFFSFFRFFLFVFFSFFPFFSKYTFIENNQFLFLFSSVVLLRSSLLPLTTIAVCCSWLRSKYKRICSLYSLCVTLAIPFSLEDQTLRLVLLRRCEWSGISSNIGPEFERKWTRTHWLIESDLSLGTKGIERVFRVADSRPYKSNKSSLVYTCSINRVVSRSFVRHDVVEEHRRNVRAVFVTLSVCGRRFSERKEFLCDIFVWLLEQRIFFFFPFFFSSLRRS